MYAVYGTPTSADGTDAAGPPPADRQIQLPGILAQAYAHLLSAQEPLRLLPEMLTELQRAYQLPCCCYARRDGAGSAWLYVDTTGAGTAAAGPAAWMPFCFASQGLERWITELEAGHEIMCRAGELSPAEQAYASARGIAYLVVLPVWVGGNLSGVLWLGFGAGQPVPTEQESALLRGFPTALGAALERQVTERLLGEAHIELSNILGASTEYAVMTADAGLRILRCNPMADAMFNELASCHVGSNVAGSGLFELLGVDLAELLAAVLAERSFETECELALDSGRELIIHTSISGMRDEQGVLSGYLIMSRDLTELRQQDRRMLEQQRMQSIGLLAGGVAHDFNNILMGILGYASLAKDRLEEDHPAYRMLGTIEQSAERAADLTRALLAYARGGKAESMPVMLDAMAEELLDILRTNLPKGLVVEKQFAANLPYILADPAQIQQVVMNLCLNAGEAIVQKKTLPEYAAMNGRLLLQTGTSCLQEPLLQELGLSPELAGQEFAYLRISDNGCGMNEATLKRIFEPFFTTKFAGRGLGLAAVEGIVRNHGGGLQVLSTPGEGSSFTLFLPVGGYMATADATAHEMTLGAGETIFVVDDEEIVRQLALLTLTNLGYRVMLARDGAEGLSVYEAECAGIDAVLLDITLPGRSGLDLLESFLALKPQTPVLLTSGFDETVTSGMIGDGKAAGFLRKPYTPETLARAVRLILQPDHVPTEPYHPALDWYKV